MATILRSRGSSTGASAQGVHPANFTFSDMGSQGNDYVLGVRAEAAKIVQQAQAEADAIRARAEAEGRAAAEQTIAKLLDQRVGKQLETLRPALNGVVAEIQASRGEWQEHWRNNAIKLAVGIAERIVRRELGQKPEISQEWIAEALRLAAGSGEITIRLSPQDMNHLRGHAEKLCEATAGVADAKFEADASISPGGCVIATRHGVVDQQVESQLQRLAEELD